MTAKFTDRLPLPWSLRRRTSSQQRLQEEASLQSNEADETLDANHRNSFLDTKFERLSGDDASPDSRCDYPGSKSHSPIGLSPELAALLEQEGQAVHESEPAPPARDNKAVSWRSLPRKDQLMILTLARLAEPLAQTSLQAYMFFMLKSFDTSKSDSQIATEAGWLAGSFTGAQCLTAVWWGRLADKEWLGRKNVLLIGLVGTLISTIGFGFSRTFASAMLFRFFGGILNGNVGVMRTVSCVVSYKSPCVWHKNISCLNSTPECVLSRQKMKSMNLLQTLSCLSIALLHRVVSFAPRLTK